MSDTLILGIVALAGLWWLASTWDNGSRRRRFPERLEAAVPVKVPAGAPLVQPQPRAQPPPKHAKPVAAMPTVFGRDVDVALARVMDSVAKPAAQSGTGGPKQDIPYDLDEVKRVMTGVLSAINAAVPPGSTPLDLYLVSVDAARKTSDAYKTLTYEGYVTAYSQRRNVAVKLFVVVDVTASGVLVPRQLVQSSAAAVDDGGIRAAGDVDALAPFEPALRFDF